MPQHTNDLVCISHLRWNFVFQRPQHLMTRAARDRRVFYVEEPVEVEPGVEARLDVREENGVTVIVPQVPRGLDEDEVLTRALVQDFLRASGVRRPTAWVYTPMRLPLVEGLDPSVVVYDCMDELANFKFAPRALREREARLFRMADLVFTGGHRLWEAKREQHPRTFPFPSSVDVAHFAGARDGRADPADQAGVPRPRLGFYGVIDERFDVDLLAAVASRRPEWHFVLLGPVVKIDEGALPRGENLHYLGMKRYEELPSYLAHWDVALLPFARNEATEFISPTKTPEYLAAGVPVVSTDIRDVVRPYGEQNIVRIASDADEFEAAVAEALTEDNAERMRRADRLLSRMSWDRTWREMDDLIREAGADSIGYAKTVRNWDDTSTRDVVSDADLPAAAARRSSLPGVADD
ncbi:glycosyltransferase family 1 protein [Deinococcus pimensis]|uniref:glycosyltransferase family 1 protein n=1 Tax=Deinococcus pimensis TaxID=309888 RepID=UPI0004BCA54C|nr:glycosyltransferase family 1 protein [Deinococcus pimensis]